MAETTQHATQSAKVFSIQIVKNQRAANLRAERRQELEREIELCKMNIHRAENLLAGEKLRLAKAMREVSHG